MRKQLWAGCDQRSLAHDHCSRRRLDMRLLKKKLPILLLDDDPSMQRLVKAILTREGFKADVFLTGRQAITAIDGGRYATLLLHRLMPHEGGKTPIPHLRRKNPGLTRRALPLAGSPPTPV